MGIQRIGEVDEIASDFVGQVRDSQKLQSLIKKCPFDNYVFRGADPNDFCPRDNLFALEIAVRKRSKEVIDLLLEYGADVNIKVREQ